MEMYKEAERLLKKYGSVDKWTVMCKAGFVLTVFKEFCGKGEQNACSYKYQCWIDVLHCAFFELCKIPNSGIAIENQTYKEDKRMLNESSSYDYSFGTARFHFHKNEEWSLRGGYEGTDWYLTVTQEEQR